MSSAPKPTPGRKPSKTRAPKDERIARLKSELKVSKEENDRLRKEIERSKHLNGIVTPSQQNRAPRPDEEQHKKFREAMRAVKQVTVKQEICLRILRKKATQRRKDIKERDAQIKMLERKVRSLETAGKAIQGDQDLHAKIKEIQMKYDEVLQQKDDLEQMLDEKEARLEALQKQKNSLLASSTHHSDGESVESGSLRSVSTENDFNVARLKIDLAKKDEKILALQNELDNIKDELYVVRQQKNSSSADGFGTSAPDSFFKQESFPVRHASGDEWTTDDNDTDFDSDFGGEKQQGGSFFKEKDVGSSGDPFSQFTSNDTNSFNADFW